MQEKEKINVSPVGTNGEQVLGEEPVVVQETPIDMTKVSMTSRGERLCGISFNPSGSEEVATVKRACAYLMDVIEKHREVCIRMSPPRLLPTGHDPQGLFSSVRMS